MEKSEKLNVLIVDDRPTNLVSLRAVLETLDIHIIEAASGNEALSQTLEFEFALVLLDVQMPEMDGFETAELMRGSSRTRHVPIIFVTAINKEEKHIFKGYESGAVDYLFKPLDPDILRSKVTVFLDLHRQKIELKQKNDALKEANKTIIEQHKSVIEEERLKVLLQMSGATAQEMNEPLSVLLGNIDHLQSFQGLDDGMKPYLSLIKTSGERISQTIKKINNIPLHEAEPHGNSSYIGDADQIINVLSVEKKDEDFNRIKSALDRHVNIHLERAENIATAFLKLGAGTFDIILSGYLLPDGNGLDLMSQLNRSEKKIPLAIITGHGDEVIASRMIQAGAFDYLPKSKLNGSSLLRVIQNIMEKAHLTREISAANAKIAKMATIDELTGIYNRRYLNETIIIEFERVKRYHHEMICVLADIDLFKIVNDTYGHAAGDMVLSKVGQYLKGAVRKVDTVCRFGGEEFVILMPDTGKEKGKDVAEKLKRRIAGISFEYEKKRFNITISFGVSSSCDADSADQLINHADRALYHAKDTGRDRVVVFPWQE